MSPALSRGLEPDPLDRPGRSRPPNLHRRAVITTQPLSFGRDDEITSQEIDRSGVARHDDPRVEDLDRDAGRVPELGAERRFRLPAQAGPESAATRPGRGPRARTCSGPAGRSPGPRGLVAVRGLWEAPPLALALAPVPARAAVRRGAAGGSWAVRPEWRPVAGVPAAAPLPVASSAEEPDRCARRFCCRRGGGLVCGCRCRTGQRFAGGRLVLGSDFGAAEETARFVELHRGVALAFPLGQALGVTL